MAERGHRPGYKITDDESLFSWYGKGDCSGGMPRVIKNRRKLEGIGCEAKTVADVAKRERERERERERGNINSNGSPMKSAAGLEP